MLWLVDLNYNLACDWLISTTTFNVIGLLDCPIQYKLSDNELSDNNLTDELVEDRSFF